MLSKLRAREQANSKRRQGLLTAGGKAGGGILDGLQRAVHFEHLADGDDALGSVLALSIFTDPTEPVIAQAESKGMSRTQALSGAADSREKGGRRRT